MGKFNEDKFVGIDSLKYVEDVQKKEGIREKRYAHARTYSEGVYYSKILFACMLLLTVLTTAGVTSYLMMPDSTYYTTDYSGEVRVLSPDRIALR